MNVDSLVTVDLTAVDYEDLLELLCVCSEVTSCYSDLSDLAADFRFYCELLESNRR